MLYFILIAWEREARSNIFFILYLPTQQRKMAKGLYKEIRKWWTSTMFILFHTLENISLKIAVLRDMINYQRFLKL